jgi:hypothetical protein
MPSKGGFIFQIQVLPEASVCFFDHRGNVEAINRFVMENRGQSRDGGL